MDFTLYEEEGAKSQFPTELIPQEIWDIVEPYLVKSCVDIVVVDKQQKLFRLPTRRAKPMPGLWYFGGRAKSGETKTETAVRIMKDEAGLNLTEDRFQGPVRAPSYLWKANTPVEKPYHGDSLIYTVELTADEREKIVLDPNEYDTSRGLTVYRGKKGIVHESISNTYETIFGRDIRRIVRLRPDHVGMLAGFFSALAADPDSRHFHPHPFDYETAVRIASHVRDRYYAMVDFKYGGIVCYGMLRYTDKYPDPSLGIATLPGLRGQGLGDEMIDHLIKEARKSGAPFVTLFVDKDNPAVHLYERKGFTLEQALPPRDPNELRGTLKF